VFEQYNEKARRAIFFARYEASQFGTLYIESEHLLLALIREDPNLRKELLKAGASLESVRKQIERERPPQQKVSTSVDMPLSEESKQVLIYASEEASASDQQVIDPGHLVLGLLRVTGCLAATLLGQLGIQYDAFREILKASANEPSSPAGGPRSLKQRSAELSGWPWLEDKEPAAASLRAAVAALTNLLGRAQDLMDKSDRYGEYKLRRKPWSRKEAVGHLIDWATAHHDWFARALLEPQLTMSAYPSEDRVIAQQFRQLSWQNLIELWAWLNALLVHLLILLPEEKLNILCRIGIEEPVPLLKVVERYVEHSEDILGQILSRLN